MREHYKENIVKEGKIEKGNIAIIDFEGFKDGVAFEGGKGENSVLIVIKIVSLQNLISLVKKWLLDKP